MVTVCYVPHFPLSAQNMVEVVYFLATQFRTTVPKVVHLYLTCLQWFSNTIRQVSGSAVHGLEGAAPRLDRLPGPRGFNLLSQLILDTVGDGSKGHTDSRQDKEHWNNEEMAEVQREQKDRERGWGGGERQGWEEEKGKRQEGEEEGNGEGGG